MGDQALTEDIAALNLQFLNLVARNFSIGDVLSLRLNIAPDFSKAVSSMSMADLKKVADMGTCLVQPLIDSQTITNAAKLTLEQGQAHLRSAARIKLGLTR